MPEILITVGSMCQIRDVPDILLMCRMRDAGYPCNQRLNMPDMGLLLHLSNRRLQYALRLNTAFISHAPSRLCYLAYDDELAISIVTGPFPSIFFAIYDVIA